MVTRRKVLTTAPAAAVVAIASLCQRDVVANQATPAGQEYNPEIDPASFTSTIDNPYMPLTPGTIFVYEGRSAGAQQSNVVSVTSETRTVMGVACVVVNDRVFEGDTLLEDTNDWYAQDADGNVWYFGEDVKSL